MTMRVWLVDERTGDNAASLQAGLKQLAERPEAGLTILGMSPYRPDFAAAMRSMMPDLIIINDGAWPEDAAAQEALGLGPGVVVATTAERGGRFQAVADLYPVVLIPASSGPEALWLALVSAVAGRHRQQQWKSEVAGLQQRLSDRIIIERAKGILVQRLGISEEDAYKRLRVLSRRQRRQIRDIAQSLVDTQFLFTPDANGFGDSVAANHLHPENEEPRPRF
jgi:AmiR/NasT family two-component response regulator